MKSDNVNLFRTLEPPPGGVERFRRRLEAADAATRQPSASRIVSAGLAAALVAVVVIALDQAPSSRDLHREVDAGAQAVDTDRRTEGADRSDDAADGGGAEVAIAGEFRSSPAFARLLGQPLRSAETLISVDDRQVSVAELPSTNSKIRIYQIRDN